MLSQQPRESTPILPTSAVPSPVTVVEETPVIPTFPKFGSTKENSCSSQLNVVEETPALFTVPDFKNYKRNLTRKENERNVEKGRDELVKNQVQGNDTALFPKNFVICDDLKQSEQESDHLVKADCETQMTEPDITVENEEISENSEDNKIMVGTIDSQQIKQEELSNSTGDNQSTKPRDDDVVVDSLEADTDRITSDKNSSESQNTQESVSILKPKVTPLKVPPSLKIAQPIAGSSQKKKRKCFMLEDNEESLDFGSYVDELEANTRSKTQNCNAIVDDITEVERNRSTGVQLEHNVIPVSDSVEIIEDTDTLADLHNPSVAIRNMNMDTQLNLSSQESQPSILTSQINKSPGVEIPDVSLKLTFGSLKSEASTLDPQTINTVKESDILSEHNEENGFQMSDKQNVHNISAVLVSPDTSFSNGQSQSPVDIFQIGSEMPTVDASPLDAPCSILGLSPEDGNRDAAVNKAHAIKPDKKVDVTDKTNIVITTKDSRQLSPCPSSSAGSAKTFRGFAKKNSPYIVAESLTQTADSKDATGRKESIEFTPQKYKTPSAKHLSSNAVNVGKAVIEDVYLESMANSSTPVSNLRNSLEYKSPRNVFGKVSEQFTPIKTTGNVKSNKFSPNPFKYSPSLKKVQNSCKEKSETYTPEVVELEQTKISGENTVNNDQRRGEVGSLRDLDSDTALPDTYENKKSLECQVNEINKATKTGETNSDYINLESVNNDIRLTEITSGDLNDANLTPRSSSKKIDMENVTNLANDNENAHVGSSPEFNLDTSGEDEESPEKKALQAISDFNRIKNFCIGKSDIGTGHINSVFKHGSRNSENKKETDNLKRKTDIAEDKYSTNLDSSPIESRDGSGLGSQRVILESDLEDDCEDITAESKDDSDDIIKTRTLKRVNRIESDESDIDNIQKVNKELDTHENEHEKMEEDEEVVKRKGVKRAIESDDSSEGKYANI